VSDVTRLLYEVLKVTLRGIENRSWKSFPRAVATHSTFNTSVTVFYYTDRPLAGKYLVKIFAGSLRIFKDLQGPTRIFKDLQRSYKDPQRQGSLKDPERFHEDLLKILWRSCQRCLQRSFQGSLRIFKDLIRILNDLKRILSSIFKRSLSESLRILLGSWKVPSKIFRRILERSLSASLRILLGS